MIMGKRKLPAVGDAFGKLTVIAVPIDTRLVKGGLWTCKCECGIVVQLHGTRLLSNAQKSCGCGMGKQAKRLPQIGEKFGDWTVLAAPNSAPGRRLAVHGKWKCQCKCTRVRLVDGNNLIQGGSNGCGCAAKKKTLEHHRVRHAAKVSWKKLLRGVDRGEAVMDVRWREFEIFFGDLGERPLGTLLSRHNLDGTYGPSSCFWEDRVAQIRRLRAKRLTDAQELLIKDGSTKRCTKCKEEKSIDDFYVNVQTKDKRHSCCKLCADDQVRAHYLANPAKHMLARARSRSRDKGFEFALSPEHLEPLPTHCPVFGFALTRGNGQQDPTAYSLDRIDNKKGYVPGNVVVMSYLANRLKNDGTAWQHARIAQWMRTMEMSSQLLHETAGTSAGLL